MARIPTCVAAAICLVLLSGPVYAVTCQGMPQPTQMDICQSRWVCTGDGWVEVYYAAGTACNDNDACTSSDVCNGGNFCSGTLTSPPGVPDQRAGRRPRTSPARTP